MKRLLAAAIVVMAAGAGIAALLERWSEPTSDRSAWFSAGGQREGWILRYPPT